MNKVNWPFKIPWLLTIIHLELDIGRHPESVSHKGLHVFMDCDALIGLCRAEINTNDVGSGIFVTSLDKSVANVLDRDFKE